MANVDLVDLLPILKAILKVKGEYKEALHTTEGDFGVYPTLTENFLDESYNEGYEVGFKQCLKDYISSYDGVEILRPRQMREVVSTNFSDSGSYDYDTLTSIMYYCLRIRQNLKTILDLDTDLFELYPPQLVSLSESQWAAGLNDGYIAGLNYVEEMTLLPPTINYFNNYFWLTSEQSHIPTYEMFYKIGSLEGEWIPYEPGDKLPIETSTRVYAYAKAGTKNSEVASRLCEYDDFLAPTIVFTNNIISIISNYGDGEVKTKYKLSSWESYKEFIDYDNEPIPITSTTTVWAYNYLGSETSATVSEICTPVIVPLNKPSTPNIYFSPETNIVTISCSTPEAKIYYHKEGSNAGWIEYNGAFKIVESGTYTAMSILDGVESDISNPVVCTVSISGGGVTPSTPQQIYAPTIVCNNNKIYVYSSQSDVTLYLIKSQDFSGYNSPVDPANGMNLNRWYQYSGPVEISRDGMYWAEARLNSNPDKWAGSVELLCKYVSVTPGSGSTPGGGSGSSTDEYVAPPLMSCINSILTINPITAGSTVYYREKGTDTWIPYTSPVTINADWTYEAIAIKNGFESSISELLCTTQIPVAPIITCTPDGLVTMTSPSSDTTIVYKKDTDSTWTTYSGPFYIYEDTTYQAKAIRNGYESSVTEYECDVTLYPVNMSFGNNTLTLSCDTVGAQIFYKTTDSTSTWTLYNGPITDIFETTTYQAKAYYNGHDGSVKTLECVCPYAPIATLDSHYVRATSNTVGAQIYWKKQIDSDWTLYTGAFYASEYGVYQFKSFKDTNYSGVNSYTFGYPMSAPTITFYDATNTITISGGGTLWYRIVPNTTWIQYTEPFEIYEDSTIEARAEGGDSWFSQIATLECEYNYIPYNERYLTLEVVDNQGSIQLAQISSGGLYYSTDLITWNSFPLYSDENGAANNKLDKVLTFNPGTKIYFKRTTNKWRPGVEFPVSSDIGVIRFLTSGTIYGSSSNTNWSSTGRLKVYGNILSLIYGDNFASYNTIPDLSTPDTYAGYPTPGIFAYMFRGCAIYDAAHLILPNNVTNRCYNNMLAYTYIQRVPELPAGTLLTGCYNMMFFGSWRVNYVKCLANSVITDYTNDWLRDSSVTGTFIKKTGVTWPTGVSGIPTGWTVEESNS